jgi:hypothetical protein
MSDDTKTQGAEGAFEPGDVTDVAPAPARRSGPLRRVLVWVLVVVCSIAVAVTGVTWWAHYTVMDTNGYMKIVGPVGKDPEAIDNLSQYVSSEIVSLSGLDQQIANGLPSQLQGLSGTLTAQVQAFIAKGAAKVLGSSQAYELWLQANRTGHEQLVALLRGENGTLSAKGSNVNLNLLPLISEVLTWVDQQVPGGLGSSSPPAISSSTSPDQAIQQLSTWSGEQLPAGFGQITLLKSDALGTAQTAVKWFDRMVWILPLVVAALVALTLWLSRRRARTAIALAVGAVIAVVAARLIALFGSQYLTSQVKTGGGHGLIRQVVNAALGPLTTITIAVCVIGAVVAVAIWFLGRRDAHAGRSRGGRASA